ncbi:daptide-type RiPP biosynthesis dehydogenase [Streptomyces sp. NPDC051569]|uniref:daptide-type RiPP biosynthesis dehydogenase n=1 Tax=Streptomyces sp. NPDC051569 TaxID=3365661 RepID=UPI00378F3EAC
MKATFRTPPAPMRDVAHVADLLRRDQPAAVTLLADPAVADQDITRSLLAQVESAGLPPRLVRGGGRVDLPSVERLAGSLTPDGLLIGVGGGTTLDLAKLAALVAARPEALRWLTAPQRSGMVALPPRLGESARVLAVPTTLGTGSELGTVACYEHAGSKRLVTGPCLRPEAAVWAPEATATLPAGLIAEGVLEALFRTVSPYAGDSTELPEQDAAVEELAGRLVDAGYEVAEHRAAGRAVGPALRLRIAELSGESQIGHINLGRDPYAVKGWPIANELSTTLGLPKMRAVAAVWPVLWRRVGAGDDRLGDAGRIDRLWTVLRQRAPWLDADPATGLAGLIRAWRVEPATGATPERIDTAVTRTMRAWGAGLPMLGGLTASDLRSLLTEALRPGQDGATAAAPGPTDQRVAELHSVT